jgi:cation diffusion facilitator family transporter
VSTLFFVVLGLGFAFYTKSDSILFDGIYSFIALCISIITLKVSKLAEQPDDDLFHFGYTQFEPLVNVFKAMFILAACVLAIFSAVQSLMSGGNPLKFGFAVIYGVLASSGCFAMGFYMKYKAKKTISGLLQADAAEWLVDGLISFAVLVGFVVGFVLEQTRWHDITPFVDPLLLILITIFALPVPIKIFLSNVREIVFMAPPDSFVLQIEEQLKKATRQIALEDYEFRVVKQGRQTILLIHLMVSDKFYFHTVADLDTIRGKMNQQMLEFNPEIIMDVLFIKNKKWAR